MHVSISAFKIIVISVSFFCIYCVSSIPVHRTAENVKKGMMRTSFNASLEIDNYPEDSYLSSTRKIGGSGILFSTLIEYGFTDKINIGTNFFASPGEAGATWNCHYQLSKKHAGILHTCGLYTGYIISALNHNNGHSFVFAPTYMFDVQKKLFFGLRYIHRIILYPVSVNIGGVVSKAPPYQITVEAIAGYRKDNILLPLVIGYNPVFNWWQVWLGLTAYKVR